MRPLRPRSQTAPRRAPRRAPLLWCGGLCPSSSEAQSGWAEASVPNPVPNLSQLSAPAPSRLEASPGKPQLPTPWEESGRGRGRRSATCRSPHPSRRGAARRIAAGAHLPGPRLYLPAPRFHPPIPLPPFPLPLSPHYRAHLRTSVRKVASPPRWHLLRILTNAAAPPPRRPAAPSACPPTPPAAYPLPLPNTGPHLQPVETEGGTKGGTEVGSCRAPSASAEVWRRRWRRQAAPEAEAGTDGVAEAAVRQASPQVFRPASPPASSWQKASPLLSDDDATRETTLLSRRCRRRAPLLSDDGATRGTI